MNHAPLVESLNLEQRIEQEQALEGQRIACAGAEKQDITEAEYRTVCSSCLFNTARILTILTEYMRGTCRTTGVF